MIGYNTIGYLGRLGNQMFQFAALKGIARNRGYEYCIPPSKNQNELCDHQLLVPFKLKNVSSLNIQYIDRERPTVIEDGFCYDNNLFENCPDWVNVQGYFQTEKYFKHIEKEIREDFEFKDEILEPCKEMIEDIENPISLHVRRTDYITNPNHTALDIDYYTNYLKEFNITNPGQMSSSIAERLAMTPEFERKGPLTASEEEMAAYYGRPIRTESGEKTGKYTSQVPDIKYKYADMFA